MKEGGRRKLVIYPEAGYGKAGSPPEIPPNSKLVFDVELLKVNSCVCCVFKFDGCSDSIRSRLNRRLHSKHGQPSSSQRTDFIPPPHSLSPLHRHPQTSPISNKAKTINRFTFLYFALGFLEIAAVISSMEVALQQQPSRQKSALMASITLFVSMLSRPRSLAK